MRFSFRVPNIGHLATVDNMCTMARRAEALGFGPLWVGDHLAMPTRHGSRYVASSDGRYPSEAGSPMFEALATLAYLAGITTTAAIGTSVLVVPYRNPLLAAKQLASIDAFSAGRLVVGVGVGWLAEEFRLLRTEPYAERGAVTDDYLRLYRELWSAEAPRFHGRYYDVEGIASLPKPVRPGGIPIMVGGPSPAARRRAALLGDGWHTWAGSPDDIARQVAEMRRMADEAGRDGQRLHVARSFTIRLQRDAAARAEVGEGDVLGVVRGNAEQIRDFLLAYERAGVDECLPLFTGDSAAAVLELAEEFMVEVGRDLDAARGARASGSR